MVQCLNPFEIRASLKRVQRCPRICWRCLGLNPFEIRASLKRIKPGKLPPLRSLNPFEIRASLKPYGEGLYNREIHVLIPLKSGQAWNCKQLISLLRASCLNPFEIRASLKLERVGRNPHTAGLNPFEIRASLKRRSESHKSGRYES